MDKEISGQVRFEAMAKRGIMDSLTSLPSWRFSRLADSYNQGETTLEEFIVGRDRIIAELPKGQLLLIRENRRTAEAVDFPSSSIREAIEAAQATARESRDPSEVVTLYIGGFETVRELFRYQGKFDQERFVFSLEGTDRAIMRLETEEIGPN